MSTTSLTIRHFYPAPIGRVYEAWTNPRIMSSWFYVGDRWTAQVENELRVGGTFRITMHTDNGETLVTHGTYRELDPPHRIAFTWNSYRHQGSLVIIDLTEVDNGTELTLTHSGLPSRELRDMHSQGWRGCLANLQRAAERLFAPDSH
jgi:uncharacterized protein YndB with AHSA1/START domain